MLCKAQPQITCGLLVCNLVLTGNCQFKDGLKPYNSTSGTTVLHCHAQTHKETNPLNKFDWMKLTRPSKDMIIDAETHAYILDNSPFSFCEKEEC